ncbi:hypothetical protein [Maricaulis sp.]|uniref:hypothetical protein n=1 Tax=Maricaulis sp. TaxID=1486257 RepID=UPI0026147CA3|nr:hypothetical protein [Maricaulis sp.]MDF1767937.1 hypothetical protein [Maricaulis sp.]
MKHLLTATSAAAVSMALMVVVPSPSNADIVHLDDVIIQFSLCLGNDCSNGESFGFDTLRLKENNVRIHFDDTSVSASFPRNDWRITINDSGNGGGAYFSIDDATAGRQVFRVDAGAPSNSLYIDSQGDVGIGVANATTDLHVRSGNTPTLRLEQDGSSGFTAQTFDVAANEANFFIRDVTNGSALPFRIQPGADQDTLYLNSSSRVGIGTNSPQVPLDVYASSATVGTNVSNSANRAGLRVRSQSGPAQIALDSGNNGEGWRLLSVDDDSALRIVRAGNGVVELELDVAGNLTLGGTITTSGSCSGGCDAVFDESYELPSIRDHADFMFENQHLMHVGPTPEDGPFNLSLKLGGMLSELEYAHIYIAQLEGEVSSLSSRVDALERR